MVLTKLYNRHFRKPLKLYWWKYNPPAQLNFGDELTPVIIESLFGRHCIWSPPEECNMAGAGSIIEILLKKKRGNKPILWGSGFIKKDSVTISSDDFNIKALRGKSSLERTVNINQKAVALGDPGLLASYLLQSKPEKKYRLGIVPHYVDLESPTVKELSRQKNVKIISPLNPPEEVIHDIAASECVVSSSLHGLIAADSVGTPNAHLKLSDGLTGGLYKFKDYYSVFSGPSRYILLQPDDVLDKQAEAVAQNVERLYKKPNNLDSLKQDLIKSFPY
ncbi:MAG TPA: polysaccharide pyruvyl transferase family protein [Candidatus Saccharimonadales bacterium]|nr:polysaccharide pyruvyl transferase family protein [Candidatus Saccharimonadales bacterium]